MKITSIHSLLPFVEKKPEFVVIDKGDYTVIDYVYQDSNTFDEPELMECRGIKFDRDGLIIARPFRKFFNYGEKGSGLPIHRPHAITEKLDGSMIHPVRLGRNLFFMTRKGHTDVARKAERYVMSSGLPYTEFCLAAIKDGWTPIFEYIGPDNRIVLRYEKPKLALLAMRHMVEGIIMNRMDMLHTTDMYKIPVASQVDLPLAADPKVSVDQFVRYTRALENAEGYVVYFDDGYMVKVKAEDYVLKHRALDDLGSKKKVVALCCQGFMDDVLPILSEADAAELLEFNDALQSEIRLMTLTAIGLAAMVEPVGVMTRKHFALDMAPQIKPRWLAGVVFGFIDGKDARMQVLKAVEKGGYMDLNVKWRGE
jgi:RNA ligase